MISLDNLDSEGKAYVLLEGYVRLFPAAMNYLAYTTPDEASGTVTALMFWFVCTVMYFIPSIVGWRKRNRAAIIVLNFFLGWTVIGWIVALVWAFTTDQPQQIVVVNK